MFEIIYLSLAILLAVLTLAPLSWSQVWWIRGLDFPRLQLSVLLSVLLIVGFVVIRDWTSVTAVAMGLIIGCLVCQPLLFILFKISSLVASAMTLPFSNTIMRSTISSIEKRCVETIKV